MNISHLAIYEYYFVQVPNGAFHYDTNKTDKSENRKLQCLQKDEASFMHSIQFANTKTSEEKKQNKIETIKQPKGRRGTGQKNKSIYFGATVDHRQQCDRQALPQPFCTSTKFLSAFILWY